MGQVRGVGGGERQPLVQAARGDARLHVPHGAAPRALHRPRAARRAVQLARRALAYDIQIELQSFDSIAT